MLDTGSIPDGFFPIFGRNSGFFRMPTMLGSIFPFAVRQYMGLPAQNGECESECACETPAPENMTAEVDDEMKKRRELNALREQMRIAAEKDDFEKAIELRERIKEME